jgi:hypothetical protein
MYVRSLNMRKAKKVQELAKDMAFYAEGGIPSEAALEAAPLLLTWRPSVRQALCLEGVCSRHPNLGDAPIVTSEIWWMSDDWVRTTSRLYRLGMRVSE